MNTALGRMISARYADSRDECEIVEVTVAGVQTLYTHFDDNIWAPDATVTTDDKEIEKAVRSCVDHFYASRQRLREQEAFATRRKRTARLKAEAAESSVSVDTLLIVEALDHIRHRLKSIEDTMTS